MSSVKDSNYFVANGWMINELGLKGNELIIYAVIYGFSQDGENWYSGGQQYLAEWTQTTKKTVRSVIENLIAKGFIDKKEKEINGVKFCCYKASFTPPDIPGTKCTQGGISDPEKVPQGVQNVPGVGTKCTQGGYNSSLILLKENINNINKREGFTKPTIEEVAEYCRANNYKIDAEQFWHFYESKGWCVGNHPMKSWKSCVVTWAKREEKNKNHQSSSYDQPVPEGFDELFR